MVIPRPTASPGREWLTEGSLFSASLLLEPFVQKEEAWGDPGKAWGSGHLDTL